MLNINRLHNIPERGKHTMKIRHYHIIAVRTKPGSAIYPVGYKTRMTDYPMKHGECMTMISKFVKHKHNDVYSLTIEEVN